MAKMTSNDVKMTSNVKNNNKFGFVTPIMLKRGISHFHAIRIQDFKILVAKYNKTVKSDVIMTSLLRQI